MSADTIDFDDNDVAWVGDLRVVREDDTCPECGSNITYHPEHIIPENLIQCFNCQYVRGRRWREMQLTDYTEETANHD